jgi:methyl-accepting chemotaxis protein
MRSLFAKIVLWFCCAAAVTVVGSAFVSALSLREEDTSREAPLAQTVIYQLSEARYAYETGGPAALKAFFHRLRQVYGATGILTDAHGRDLLTGSDRSDLMRQASRRPSHELFRVGRSMVARSAEDGKYWFFQVAPRRAMGVWVLAPELLFVMAALILLCYWLAYHLTSPVRKLQRAVERFGRGDFSARVNSTRRDELGQLARTFDRMAERIDTLIRNVRNTLQEQEGGKKMTDKEKFEGFKRGLIEENEKKYGKEIREKYGEKTVEQSNAKIMGMTQAEYEETEQLTKRVNEAIKAAFETGDPKGELAMQACELHKQWLMRYWDSYTKEAHKGMGQMYVADERFAAYYDAIAPGCALFLRDALEQYCS